AFFILAAVCEGATVRAAAEHDAERPFGLGWAWRSGVTTMWVIVRFRLLLLALALPVVLILAGLIFATAVSFINQNRGDGAVLVWLRSGVAVDRGRRAHPAAKRPGRFGMSVRAELYLLDAGLQAARTRGARAAVLLPAGAATPAAASVHFVRDKLERVAPHE